MNLNLTELRKRIEAGLIMADKHPEIDLHIYNYTKRTQYERVWDEYTRICRGVILDLQERFLDKNQLKGLQAHSSITPERIWRHIP